MLMSVAGANQRAHLEKIWLGLL